jgi:hypothetical protein
VIVLDLGGEHGPRFCSVGGLRQQFPERKHFTKDQAVSVM